MHELSIAMSLIEVASEEAAGLGPVKALHLRLGPYSGVVEEALLFAFDLAAKGTAVAGARLVIERVPITARCPACDDEVELESAQSLRCPRCGTPTPEISSGRELELFALEVEDDADPDRGSSPGHPQEERPAGA